MEQYRKTPRADFLDYDVGDYFVTICTKGHKHFFGEITDNEIHLNELGMFCQRQLEKAHSFNDNIEIIVFTVMPNHVHAIIRIGYGEDAETSPSEGNLFQRSPNPYMRANPSCQRHITVLSRYVSSFKGAVTKYAKSIGLNFGWQPRYHDHFIRGAQDGNNIYEYIVDNVARWDKDCYRHRKESPHM